ncbi:MAG: hypothetical protein LBG19_09090 [Prevotellaceae bacterium]|nr:hypothetical protein [Prevotellaceae bacterium]
MKGAAYRNYSPRIARGILLHRAIDDFTDRHPKVAEAKRLLQPSFIFGHICRYVLRPFSSVAMGAVFTYAAKTLYTSVL